LKLQTEILLESERYNQIDYNSKILLFGSCFAENIAQKLNYFKFQNLQNPFGILFHPLAIENLITNAINTKFYSDQDLFYHEDQWHCYEAHSKLSNPSKALVLKTLNDTVKSTHQYILDSSHLIITFGTSWVYRHIETDQIVANCHKVPQKKFIKSILSVEEIAESLQAIVSLVKSVNANITIIFTVSPVRHLKDGYIENTQSKAHLITAIHGVLKEFKNLYYFPAYEIMMDELRDYRFYEADMLHPNATAIQYIWEKFQKVWIADTASVTMNEVDVVQKGLAHKPFQPQSDSHLKFIQNIEVKKKAVEQQFPHIAF
jgi:hypothetical protein